MTKIKKKHKRKIVKIKINFYKRISTKRNQADGNLIHKSDNFVMTTLGEVLLNKPTPSLILAKQDRIPRNSTQHPSFSLQRGTGGGRRRDTP
jgi:hypothetical protein